MDVKPHSRANSERIKRVEAFVKVSDASKYNLRCNRNLSEKMTKKDFVYDIRRPLQTSRKVFEKPKKQPNVLPEHQQRNTISDLKNYPDVSKNLYIGGGGDAPEHFPIRRILNFECNFCNEHIATLFSLSTHVKFHRRSYCKKCYWILRDGETMKRHVEVAHANPPHLVVKKSVTMST